MAWIKIQDGSLVYPPHYDINTGMVNCHLNQTWLENNGYVWWTNEEIEEWLKENTQQQELSEEFKTACYYFRTICYEIRELIGDDSFKGGYDEIPNLYGHSAYKTDRGEQLSIALLGCDGMCRHEGEKNGLGSPAWWYKCWELADEPGVPSVPDEPGVPLTLTARQANSTVQLTKAGSPTVSGLQYRTDSTGSWKPYTIDTVITLNSVDDYVQFKNIINSLSTDGDDYVQFIMSGEISASGNVQSMLNWSDSCSECCYYSLFNNCKSLTTAPELPATTLAAYCYASMFRYCLSLTTAPELPAITLASHCYEDMFKSCTSLTQAPKLPATTLADGCYGFMFQFCTSLITAPELPAIALVDNCYAHMFEGCTNLTTVPELPFVAVPDTSGGLSDGCCRYMFSRCSSLSNLSVSFTAWSNKGTEYWVQGVASTGTFNCPEELPVEYGDSRIPEGWTVPTAGTYADAYTVSESGDKSYNGTYNKTNNMNDGKPVYQLQLDAVTKYLFWKSDVNSSGAWVMADSTTADTSNIAYYETTNSDTPIGSWSVAATGYGSVPIVVEGGSSSEPVTINVTTPVIGIRYIGDYIGGDSAAGINLSPYVTVSDGSAPTFTLVSSSDSGITVSNSYLSGVCSVTGAKTIKIQVSSATYTGDPVYMTITYVVSPMTINTTDGINSFTISGATGTTVSQQFNIALYRGDVVADIAPVYTYALMSGSLPTGVTLDSANNCLTGTLNDAAGSSGTARYYVSHAYTSGGYVELTINWSVVASGNPTTYAFNISGITNPAGANGNYIEQSAGVYKHETNEYYVSRDQMVSYWCLSHIKNPSDPGASSFYGDGSAGKANPWDVTSWFTSGSTSNEYAGAGTLVITKGGSGSDDGGGDTDLTGTIKLTVSGMDQQGSPNLIWGSWMNGDYYLVDTTKTGKDRVWQHENSDYTSQIKFAGQWVLTNNSSSPSYSIYVPVDSENPYNDDYSSRSWMREGNPAPSISVVASVVSDESEGDDPVKTPDYVVSNCSDTKADGNYYLTDGTGYNGTPVYKNDNNYVIKKASVGWVVYTDASSIVQVLSGTTSMTDMPVGTFNGITIAKAGNTGDDSGTTAYPSYRTTNDDIGTDYVEGTYVYSSELSTAGSDSVWVNENDIFAIKVVPAERPAEMGGGYTVNIYIGPKQSLASLGYSYCTYYGSGYTDNVEDAFSGKCLPSAVFTSGSVLEGESPWPIFEEIVSGDTNDPSFVVTGSNTPVDGEYFEE